MKGQLQLHLCAAETVGLIINVDSYENKTEQFPKKQKMNLPARTKSELKTVSICAVCIHFVSIFTKNKFQVANEYYNSVIQFMLQLQLPCSHQDVRL